MTTSTELLVVDSLVPAQIFANTNDLDAVLDEIAAKARAHQPDISTVKGRKEIASVANKVARSKTLLDEMGKALVAGWKKQSAAVDAERRRLRENLDSLKAEVRKPLTDFEEAEDRRKIELGKRVQAIRDLADQPPELLNDIADIGDRIADVEAVVIDESFGEYTGNAAIAKDASLRTLKERLAHAQEQARLAAERAEQEKLERQRQAEEEEVRAKARVAQAAADAARRERARFEEIERARQAEADRVAAEEARRAADQEHRAQVNNEALSAITKFGDVTPDQAKAIVIAIVAGEIPHVSIRY